MNRKKDKQKTKKKNGKEKVKDKDKDKHKDKIQDKDKGRDRDEGQAKNEQQAPVQTVNLWKNVKPPPPRWLPISYTIMRLLKHKSDMSSEGWHTLVFPTCATAGEDVTGPIL